MFSKPWFRSKTVWLNVVTFVSPVLGVVLTAAFWAALLLR